MTGETQPDSPIWRTEHVRLTAFYAGSHPTSLARDWWNAVTGSPPEGILEEPRTGTVQLQGAYEDAPLVVRAERGRFDIARPFSADQPTPDTLPAFTDVLQPFVELADRWIGLKTSPPIQRLGFGASAIKRFPRIEDCRAELDGYLPSIDMQTTEPMNFMYQVNHQCVSRAVDGLSVNRITKWSFQQLEVAAESPTFAIQLEMDINTTAEHTGSLDRPALLFRELASFADQFAKEGDRP